MLKKQLIAAVIVIVAIAGVLIAVITSNNTRTDTPQALTADPTVAPATAELVRENTRYLDEVGDDAVTVVEFLDFECESCAAMYPYVEQVREKYAGQINVAVRYFPIPSHRNAENSAVAVEAAAQQGQMQAMYSRMYETQIEWGEKQTSEVDRFRGFAEELGLDMAAFDAAVADPATLERVISDRAEGTALGVTGTPTFFVNGKMLELTAFEDLDLAVQSALDNG
ncbi:thioredoxin domain-containing protein [Clavibacter michiganensis subsp. phaseoli]|uniref:Thioredoxin domain-containing protein n=1 Tax=Clavibacter phaseoli TaxID=1734031 RepID=A0A8I0VDK5_9MICO|nr:thioredoxin domain-containing protein [Clavibacter phaseoli]MBF4632642.1 thioredoxin domain-containing protein [Clavibacter phaseoli]